ncbi:MAG: oxaloacetate-decarboxylating malate dehydrogenase [Gammaproteobacteria bacterium]|nr:oxaloacetate-decarboxylating malate dehydrogenase [Gammaproteobacteria bacterium]
MANQHFLTGTDLLRNSKYNKSTAFTEEERDQFKLRGLLPANVGSMETQLARVLENLRRKESPIEKYIFLSALQDRNERLFYQLIIENFQEAMPLIYTPTVGQACKEFGHIFRTEKGFYVTANDRGRIRKILDNWPHRDIRIIVVTDGERILGLGDLGANGMGIPIGKLGLYCACAGISPEQCLPAMFDVGTNNQELLDDPVYLGIHGKRVAGQAYFDLMDEFVEAATDAFPGVLIQFEDFAAGNAYTHLNKYRDQTLCFNDDIQGTAAVVLSGIYTSTRISNRRFKDLKFTFLGAGSAATGIGMMIAQALMEEGVSEEEAYQRLWFFNSKGLVNSARENLAAHVQPFAHDIPDQSFLDAIKNHQPDILIGATGTPATFTEEMVRLMANIKSRPGIFALSNPTTRAECTAEEAYQWTEGRGIFASGSPFPPVSINGKTYRPGQGNNSYIFPGVGLGMIACEAKTIPDTVFLESAKALSQSVTQGDLDQGSIYPPMDAIRNVSLGIATAVAKYAYRNGLTNRPEPDDVMGDIENMMYDPKY